MARRPRVTVRTEGQIVRAFMRQGSSTRREFVGRAQLAVNAYNRRGGFAPPRQFDYEKASSPFAAKVQRRTVGAARKEVKGDRITFIVESPGAVPVERGNGPGEIKRDDGGKMYIPIKSAKARRKGRGSSRYLHTAKGDIKLQKMPDGRFMLVVKRVRPFVGGYRRLRRSVESAFRRR